MHTYQLIINDDRHPVPTLKLVVASNEDGVREEAERSLVASAHHVSVAVYLNAVRLFDIGTPARNRDRPFDVDQSSSAHS
jgi:hypothetical protein